MIVRVYAVDELGDPLVGVLVRAYSGATLITQNYTALVGAEAYCELTLVGGSPPVSYTIRLSKTGVAFDGALGVGSTTPQSIDVYDPETASPTGTNYFQVTGQTFTRPVALDPNMCRCSGFVRDVAGRPLLGVELNIMNTQAPTIVDDDLVLGSTLRAVSDGTGYIIFDLYRGAQYLVQISSADLPARDIVVPDLSSVSLSSLLYPCVKSVEYDPASVAIAEGASQDVALTITDSSGVELDPLDGDVVFTSLDTTIAGVQVVAGVLVVTGGVAGATQITAERANTSIVVIPEPVLASLSVAVS